MHSGNEELILLNATQIFQMTIQATLALIGK
jgi:hypothetical protein